MFSEPPWEVRGQWGALPFLPEGFGGPETKHLNILFNADSLYQPQGPGHMLCAFLTSFLRHNTPWYLIFVMGFINIPYATIYCILILLLILLKNKCGKTLLIWLSPRPQLHALKTASKPCNEIYFHCIPVSLPLNWSVNLPAWAVNTSNKLNLV